MRSVILYAPHLDRDLRHILEHVPDAWIYYGEKTANGADGCVQGHHDIVKWAQDVDEDSVFVLEDDCLFTDAFDPYQWADDIVWSRAQGYDVLVGGCVQTYDPRVVRDVGQRKLIEVSAFHSAHCIVYHASSFDKILTHMKWPSDLSVGRDAKCKIAMTYPFVAHQRPSFSGILQQDVDYVPLYQQYQDHLGRALGFHP